MGTTLVTQRRGGADKGTATATEARVRAATLSCIARFGSAKTTLDDVARESGVSRATIYRVFPGGRETLLEAVLSAEVHRFFGKLADEVEGHDDLEELLVVAIGESMRFLLGHEALRTVVALEPGLVLPQLAFHRLGAIIDATTAFAAPYLVPHLASHADAVSGAEHLVRVVLSYTLHPSDSLDPYDDDSVRAFVRDHVLPALLPPESSTHRQDPTSI